MYVPVSMFWKAVSTFVESSADVSMNDNPFFSVQGKEEIILISAHHTKLTHDAAFVTTDYRPQKFSCLSTDIEKK